MDSLLGTDILMRNGDIQIATNQDFGTISGINNLQQAIQNRLQTSLGEYYIKEYGSELYKVIGKPQDELLKSRISGYIIEALLQEPRIQSVENINITFNSSYEISIDMTITIIQTNRRVNLVFPNFVLN